MLALTLLSFFAGILTILAPCVLPLLPIIIGGSATGKNKWKPYLVTLGLVLSIIAFTLLLKASTLLIDIDPKFWTYVSGGIVLVFGFIYIFPGIWDRISTTLKLSASSDQQLHNAGKREGPFGSLLIGASLGPVFASCSPTYFLIIATVLPVNFIEGVFYILVYALGLAVVMLGVALLGRKLVGNLKAFSNPDGWFKKTLGVLFILVGIAVITGFDKTVSTYVLNSGWYNLTTFEQGLIDQNIQLP